MPEIKLTRRVIAEARKQAEGRANAIDGPVILQLDREARKLGYRGWRRLIKEYRSQQNDTRN